LSLLKGGSVNFSEGCKQNTKIAPACHNSDVIATGNTAMREMHHHRHIK